MQADGCFGVSDEIVVVTGAAGQLGHAYAKALLENGAKVVGLDMTASPRIGSLAAVHGDRFRFIVTDVTSKPSLAAALSEAESALGTPTALINNAAIDAPPSAPLEENGPFEEYPEASWDKVLSVNLKGVFLCCQVFGGAMARAGRGSIVNISSIYGVVSPDQGIYEYRRRRGETFYKPVAYSASKSGIMNLTRYLAAYWGRKNVRVNTLTIAGVFNNQDADFLDAYCGRIPIGRMASPEDYVGPVLFLVAPASRYMTGASLVVDGGWTAI